MIDLRSASHAWAGKAVSRRAEMGGRLVSLACSLHRSVTVRWGGRVVVRRPSLWLLTDVMDDDR